MADGGSVGRSEEIADLLLLAGPRGPARIAVAIVVAAACVILGVLSLNIQTHFAAQSGGGRFSLLLGNGSTAATAWTGWAAALFFAVALRRLRRGVPEPPAGRAPLESLSAAQIRHGLVREYTAVRAGLAVLCAIAVTEAARGARYAVAAIAGDAVARGSLAATLIEALGLGVAAVVLGAWALTFRRQLVRMGARR